MSDQTIQQPTIIICKTIISRKWLDERGACREQVQLFEQVWPDGVAVTRETLELSAKAGLILQWFAERVLPRSDYAAYRSQWDALYTAYQSQRDTLYAALQSQCKTLYAALQSQREPQVGTLEAACEVQCDKLFSVYLAQRDTLYAAYQSQRDTLLINALCDLYESDAPP